MPPRFALRIIFWVTLSAIVIGALFGHAEGSAYGDDSIGPTLRGALDGGLAGFALICFERFVLRGRTFFRRLPFAPYLALRAAAYLVLILLALSIGHWLTPIAGERVAIRRGEIVFSIAVSVGFALYFGVDRLLGPGTLLSFVAGRYHQPRRETRALLLVDMEGSTAIAERLGEERFLTLLNRFIGDLSQAIADQGGEIHKYVGDEIIATWKLKRAGAASAAVRACFDARARLAARAGEYEREFGLRPDFRAALHCGPVVLGELGAFKMEIALIGDTMNTASRIEQACRDTGHRVLASAALLDHVATLPAGIAKEALGALKLRGKETSLELYALEAAR
jgi:adenylate cyclase